MDDVVIRGGRDEAEFWLVHPLKVTELCELTTEGCALFDNIGWKVVRVVLRDKCT